MYDSYPCEIIASQCSYNEEIWALGYNNQSAYTRLFDFQILKWLPWEIYPSRNDIECTSEEEEIFRPISFGDIFPAFLVGGIGCVTALTFCIFEYSHSKINDRN